MFGRMMRIADAMDLVLLVIESLTTPNAEAKTALGSSRNARCLVIALHISSMIGRHPGRVV